MALLECKFFSKSLLLNTNIFVVIPTKTFSDILLNPEQEGNLKAEKYQTLYLLHGGSDDASAWTRNTRIERYAEKHNVAVVMPEVDLSFYTDMAHGNKYWTYISEELPAFVQSLFPLSTKREDNFVAGLSMGGYGAFKLALRKPENFSYAISFSGAVDIDQMIKENTVRNDEFFSNVFGDLNTFKNSENDLLYLLEKAKAENSNLPKLYQACGTEDFLYQNNLRFKRRAQELGIDLTYVESPGGHDWDFWEEYIQKGLDWIATEKASKKVNSL
jgi:putative tributyrin esterase